MPRARRGAAAARRASRRTSRRRARPRPAPGGAGMGPRRARRTTGRAQPAAPTAGPPSLRSSPSRYGFEDILGLRVPDAHRALVDQLLQMRARRHLRRARELFAELGAVYALCQLAQRARPARERRAHLRLAVEAMRAVFLELRDRLGHRVPVARKEDRG